MVISVDQQYQQENVADFDFDEEESKDFVDFDVVEEESKEFQKLSLNDVPQVPKSAKPAGDFLYQDISKCLAPDTFSPYLEYLKSRPEVVLILDEKPKKNSPSTYSPSNPPDWADKWVFKLPKTYEEYVRLKSEQVPSFMASFISAE